MKAKKDIFIKTLFFMLLIKVSSMLKFSFIFGSKFACLSGSTVTMPLSGAFAGGVASFAIFAISLVVRYLVFGISSLHVLAFYVPGLFSACYFSYKNIFFRLIVPIVCIILFIVHPTGLHAFAYALFWLIPVAIYFVRSKNIFLDALASTFIAHAVGSVIWIYTVDMSAYAYYSLMPIVLFERLAIACGIFVLYTVFDYVKHLHFIGVKPVITKSVETNLAK